MMKKLALVGPIVAAGLVVAAPLASANTSHHGSGHEGQSCSLKGGSAAADSSTRGNSAANAVAQAPIAGNNIGNVGCNSFLNHDLNKNVNHNSVHTDVLSPN
jgi:hypothetical protein